MPKLELKRFSGRPQDWEEFWDGFVSAVHGNEELSTIDKFSYLRHYLEDSAKKVIMGFKLTENNYEAALDLLKQRFAKPSVIKRAHIRDLMNVQAVFNERSVFKMRELYDTVEMHFRGLEALGVDKDSYSTIIVPALMERIPESVRLNMIRENKSADEWDIEEMLTAFKNELDIREQNQSIFQEFHQSKREETRPRPQGKAHSPSSASALYLGHQNENKQGKRSGCVYCGEEHDEVNCGKVKNIEERKKVILRSGRCFCCLKKGHLAFVCKSKVVCKFCKQNHHSSICLRNVVDKVLPSASTLLL